MKKVYLLRVQQYNEEFFVGSYDPRILVRMTDQSIDVGTEQDAQRPLDKKHLQEISDYVSPRKKGMLASSILVGTKERNRLSVESETMPNGQTFYYMMFPETEAEIQDYANTLDIMDGQHRIFAFSEKYRDPDMKNSDPYAVAFSLYVTPDLQTRQIQFTITNEKQKPVSANLLLYLKEKLGMLSQADMLRYKVVDYLNSAPASPLKGRIIMRSERLPKGYKAKELVKILAKSKLMNLKIQNLPITDEKMEHAIIEYLKAWEKRYRLSYSHPGKETMTKISGLRYVLLLLPIFVEYSLTHARRFDEAFCQEMLEKFSDYKCLTDTQTPFDDSAIFRSEGATVKAASDDSTGFKAYLANDDNNGFDPFA